MLTRSLGYSLVTGLALAAAVSAYAADAPLRILYLTKSQGFEHSVVAEKDGKPSWSGVALTKLAEEMGAELTCTKDASVVNAENLKKYDLVVFYTQGDLTQSSKDGGAPMGPSGEADLLAWIRAGGRYLGFHSASDTFHGPEGGPVTPYLDMVGGEFNGHGAQFVGAVKVVDPTHPAMAHIPQDWAVKEEWYTFKSFNTKTMHVLALMDAGDERAKQEMYNTPSYPIIWCSEYGAGRVLLNGMGHREDLWLNAAFKQSIVDAIHWLMADGPAQAEPNFDQVVPESAP
ncbi:MAG TPA: ThuA domain-containing protein [Candidatus Hydrogenedentes bacterium]|nr:ThuA domain-containing protein [Candidatus Hydrogenedentota bacterium]HPG68295.1 ThuA domain-containing protein [Candidatus Hydrogenedentota bacterium]